MLSVLACTPESSSLRAPRRGEACLWDVHGFHARLHAVIFSTEEKDLLPDGGLSVPVLMAQAAWIWYWGGSSWKPGRGGTLCSSIKETDSPSATEMPSWNGSRSPDAGGASDGPRSHLHQATSSALCLPVRILASWISLPHVLLSVCSLAF